ncbi:DinB family protein [Streptomyces sp. NBC_01218]|uniref:DinB family protein n=1 Tax=Streptomyces sp. NBC_01218 TaxID=2903780 RepID=UPI002E11985C|nr:DinB family protein [Streptomyces sp. NBC_01218]
MSRSHPKDDLHSSLQAARDTLLRKLEGLSEYDARRPLTRTGTNLLGLVKHLSGVELGYFGDTFGRPSEEPFPWLDDDAEENADMWATEDESREEVVARYRRVWRHSDATIAALPLDALGTVPWWSEAEREVTLHKVLVHVTTETHRHAGHADIVRELVDGEVGYRSRGGNLPRGGATWWEAYVDRLEGAATAFRTDGG